MTASKKKNAQKHSGHDQEDVVEILGSDEDEATADQGAEPKVSGKDRKEPAYSKKRLTELLHTGDMTMAVQ